MDRGEGEGAGGVTGIWSPVVGVTLDRRSPARYRVLSSPGSNHAGRQLARFSRTAGVDMGAWVGVRDQARAVRDTTVVGAALR
jgi:hypothetical protein